MAFEGALLNDRQRKILSRGLFALSPALFLAGGIAAVDNRNGPALFGFGLVSACVSVVAGFYVRAGADHSPATEGLWPKVESMSVGDLARWITEMPSTVPVRYATALTRRLYEIALFDNHVPDDDRHNAASLLATIKKATFDALRDQPEALALYHQAIQHQEDGISRFGVGSLAWLIAENRIPKEEIVAYVARPEHVEGLPDFYAALGEPAASVLREAVAREAVDAPAGPEPGTL